MNKKENRVSKRVSIQEQSIPQEKRGNVNMGNRSILGSLGAIHEQNESSIIESFLQTHSRVRNSKRESCFNRSSIRRIVYRKDVYYEIERLQNQQCELKQEISRFRRETQERFRLKEAQIFKLREEIELTYAFNASQSTLQRNHDNQVQELQRNLYQLQKELHCMAINQNQQVLQKELFIESLREAIDIIKTDNFQSLLSKEILAQRIEEESRRRLEMAHLIKDTHASIAQTHSQMAGIVAEREASYIQLSQVSMVKPQLAPVQDMRVQELERICQKLEQSILENREYYQKEFYVTKRRYEQEIGNLKSVIERRQWNPSETQRSSRWMGCLQNDLIELCSEDSMSNRSMNLNTNSIWKRMSGRSANYQNIPLCSVLDEPSSLKGQIAIPEVVENSSQNLMQSTDQKQGEYTDDGRVYQIVITAAQSTPEDASMSQQTSRLETSIEKVFSGEKKPAGRLRELGDWLVLSTSVVLVSSLLIHLIKNR